jgi:ferrochelatase
VSAGDHDRTAILFMAYGTPERLEDVESYYTHIRRGSTPSPDQLEDLVARYRAVGGPTALNRITRRQAAALAGELERRGAGVPVHVGFKHVPPMIGEAVRLAATDGVTRAIGLVLAPHFSLRSVAEYAAYAEEARPPSMSIEMIPSWHDDPALIDVLAVRLERARNELDDPFVIFTAHSIPAKAVDQGDPYPEQLLETARLVAERAGVDRWGFAWQSAGRTDERWLGPDIAEAILQAAEAGERAVVVHAIGFVADHLEVLYDLDVEARRAASERGLTFHRVAMPNADPDFVAALADVVAPRLAEAK